MPVRPEKCAGLVQPLAGVAVAPTGMAGGRRTLGAQVGDSGLEGLNQLGQRRRRSRFLPMLVQPAASRSKVAVRAARLGGLKASLEAAVGKIYLAVNEPARVLQQPQNIA